MIMSQNSPESLIFKHFRGISDFYSPDWTTFILFRGISSQNNPVYKLDFAQTRIICVRANTTAQTHRGFRFVISCDQ